MKQKQKSYKPNRNNPDEENQTGKPKGLDDSKRTQGARPGKTEYELSGTKGGDKGQIHKRKQDAGANSQWGRGL